MEESPAHNKYSISLFILREKYVCTLTHSRGGGERERERERERIPSRLHTVSAESCAGLEHMNHENTT